MHVGTCDDHRTRDATAFAVGPLISELPSGVGSLRLARPQSPVRFRYCPRRAGGASRGPRLEKCQGRAGALDVDLDWLVKFWLTSDFVQSWGGGRGGCGRKSREELATRPI